MEIIQAIILGLVQGLTEFAPVSSSAHLVIVPWLFGWQDYGLGFDVALHMGTLVAVLTYFWRDILRYVRAIFSGLPRFSSQRLGFATNAGLTKPAPTIEGAGDTRESDRRIAWLLLLATIPGAIFGAMLESKVDDSFHQGNNLRTWGIYAIGAAMIGMGLVLALAERLHRGRGKEMEQMTLRDGVVIGLAQAFALLPGVSRSGVTITAGLFRNLARPAAARFSFLLSAPIIFGAGLKKAYDLLQDPAAANPQHISAIAVAAGFIAAAVSGYLVIRFLLGYLQKQDTMVFVYYRLVAGLVIILLALLGLR